MRQKSQLSVMGVGVLLILISAAARAQDLIEFPNEIDASIQDAVLRAGCGGTVHLAPGTYTGLGLSDDPSPIVPGLRDQRIGHIFIECGGRLIGSGVGVTVLDGSSSPSPDLGSPVIGVGVDPFNVHPVSSDYEVSHLTLISTAPAGATTPQGIAIGWADGVEIHHLEVTGFNTAIRADLSNDVEVHHVVAQGLGAAAGRCVEFRELNRFLPGALPPDGHMVGNAVHHNELSDCNIGISVFNNDGVSIHHNTVLRTTTGAQFAGAVDAEFHHNLVGQSLQRGLNLVNANDADYHHNVYCQNPIAVRYGASVVPALFGFPPNTFNEFHHETFLGDAAIFNASADRNIGTGNALSLEDAKMSTSDPQASCPAF